MRANAPQVRESETLGLSVVLPGLIPVSGMAAVEDVPSVVSLNQLSNTLGMGLLENKRNSAVLWY